MTHGTDIEAGDVVDQVLQDHGEIKRLFNEVSAGDGNGSENFARLVRKLAMHETAEEEVVHPLARHLPDGDPVVEARLAEESNAKTALAHLERLGVDAPEFADELAKVRSEILAHADEEERHKLPRLRASLDRQRLERAATVFRSAERLGPTHAHAHGPESATGNLTAGGFVALADRVRDVIRSAQRS
jgi:hemerythrin superfamily protein